MSKAVGGYVRRCERRYVPPGPPGALQGPRGMRYSVLPSGGIICWRTEMPAFQVNAVLPPMLPIPAESEPVSRNAYSPFLGRSYPDLAETEERVLQALGHALRNLLSPEPAPGPPYTHTLVSPEPIGEDEDGNPVYPPPGPTHTLTEQL